ncbi:MAG: PDDEXK nuclease domain-containing protein [Planctomycetota bacterium]
MPPRTLADGYDDLLHALRDRVRAARVTAVTAVNRELVLLYWSIGRDILDRQRRLGWGAKVIDQLARDLRRELPGTKGFSARNLRYMRNLAEAWPDEAIVQRVVAQLTWGLNVRLLDKVADPTERLWYAQKAIENGWSRNVLVLHIERDLFAAQGGAITNFATTLPPTESDLARELLKDPYKLDFLGIADDASERVLETGLVRHIRDFLLELGQGFAFVGSQVPLTVDGETFFLDLLFYHLRLRRFVVVELKIGRLRPEHTGKLNFYLSAVDALLRHADDLPSIGMVLCKDRSATVAEYALRGTTQPMAVSQFVLTKALPRELVDQLPSTASLEAELGRSGP